MKGPWLLSLWRMNSCIRVLNHCWGNSTHASDRPKGRVHCETTDCFYQINFTHLLHSTYSYHEILIRFHRIYEFFNWIERSAVSENEKGRITSLIVLISFWEANTPHLLVLYQMGFIAPARGKPHRHHPVSNPHIHTFQSAISSKMWGGVFMPGARVKNIQKKSCKEK